MPGFFVFDDDAEAVTLDEAKKIVKAACEYFGPEKCPEVRDQMTASAMCNFFASGCFIPRYNEIVLVHSRGGNNINTVLHEIAHAIIPGTYNDDDKLDGYGSDHGETFDEALVRVKTWYETRYDEKEEKK